MSILRAYLGGVLPAGTKAPEFSATDDSGRKVTSAGLRNRPYVLVFYPGDDTPTCTRQLCEVRDNFSHYQDLGVAVYGVNPRGSKSHQRFRSKFNLPFPLLVDDGGRLATLFQSGGRLARRTVYAVDGQGVIRLAERGMPRSEEILAALRSAPRSVPESGPTGSPQ